MSKIQSAPEHLALIPDGNRRWSRSHRLSLYRSYYLGIRKFIDFSLWAKSFGVRTLTVWALSTENATGRNKAELGALYKLYAKMATDEGVFQTLKRNQARVVVIGNMTLLPGSVKKALRALERRTRAFKEFTINILIGYGGKEDVLYAVRRLAAQGYAATAIDERLLRQNLRTADVPEADLIIRTSGEMRTSGFLPWQSSYSELYFAKKYWPDFGKRDLRRAILEFSQRQRRFGR